jgi:L-amino acid N-acyltransferase YncA
MIAILEKEDIALNIRDATRDDATAIAVIYNQGIEDRVATFETHMLTAEDIQCWFDTPFPIVVVEDEDCVIAFGSTSTYSARECYAGIAECSVYVKRERRGCGAGRMALEGLIRAAESAGFWKLTSRVFVENMPSRKLIGSLGFREIGVHEKHAELDGIWRDVIVVERLIESNCK